MDVFVSHFIEDRVSEMTIHYQLLTEYVEMCKTYHHEDNEPEELAVDETACDRESVRRAITDIEGEVPQLFERIVESVNVSVSPAKRQRFSTGSELLELMKLEILLFLPIIRTYICGMVIAHDHSL
jgi:hypothetical protein